MKALFTTILLLSLSNSLFAQQDYKLDIYNVEAYNRSIPALSLSITPKKINGFRLIISYVSTLFSFEKPTQEYALNEKYDNVKMSFNFKF
jgi:hypothetical protein